MKPSQSTPHERFVIVSVACNDPDNGIFDGRARYLHFEVPKGEVLEVDHDDWEDGTSFSFTDETITLHRQTYRYLHRKPWFGNWCWDAFWLPRAEAIRLLRDIHGREEWHVSAGAVKVLDWLDRQKVREAAHA